MLHNEQVWKYPGGPCTCTVRSKLNKFEHGRWGGGSLYGEFQCIMGNVHMESPQKRMTDTTETLPSLAGGNNNEARIPLSRSCFSVLMQVLEWKLGFLAEPVMCGRAVIPGRSVSSPVFNNPPTTWSKTSVTVSSPVFNNPPTTC